MNASVITASKRSVRTATRVSCRAVTRVSCRAVTRVSCRAVTRVSCRAVTRVSPRLGPGVTVRAGVEGLESSATLGSSWNHVMLFLLDANAQHLSSDSKSALTTAAGLAMASGKLTVVFLDDSSAAPKEGSEGQAERRTGEVKSALEALGLSEVSILEEKIEDKGKGSVAVGEAADNWAADLVVLSSSAVHEKHVDANLLAEFVPAPLLLLP